MNKEEIPFFEKVQDGYYDWFAYHLNGAIVSTLYVDFYDTNNFHILEYPEWLK